MSAATSLQAQEQRVEAARYALLRRLAFAMRHHMVVHLQPIGMITEVMERRLQSGSPDLRQIHEAMAKVNTHARGAVQSSLDVVSWVAPEDGVVTGLGEAVHECVDLLRSHLNFRGFTLLEAPFAAQAVSRSAVRGVLPAVLLVVTDTAPSSPADVLVGPGGVIEGRGVVTVELRTRAGSPGFTGEPHYRLLQWADVEAIAAAEGVTLTREGERVAMSFAT